MQQEELSIGRMAQLNGITVRTLRVYQEKGLLEPQRIDEITGFRYYDLSQSSTIDLIQQLKTLGFSLNDIKCIFDSNDIGLLEQQLNCQIKRIKKECQDLELIQQMGESLLDNCSICQKHPPFGVISYEYLPERRILRLAPVEGDYQDRFASDVFEEWEITLRHIKKLFLDRKYPAFLFRNICDSISKESLIEGNPTYKDAFIFVDKSHGALYEQAEIVPQGLFATTYCDTYVDEQGKFTEVKTILRMLDDIKKRNYTVRGDYLGETIADTPIFCNGRQNMFARLQIPVEPLE